MSAANIYLACGGSGIKTLKALTELMGQDPVFRHAFKNDIYYIAVDTDKKELLGLQEHTFSLVPGSNEGNVMAVQISANVQTMAPAILDVLQKIEGFEKGTSPRAEAEDRFKDHWWFNGDDNPFTPPTTLEPQKGAGQCPPVSFFLAWKQLPKITEQLKGIFADIIKKRGGDEKGKAKRTLPLDDLNVHVIAGLAGGTGRGCWEVLAFKLGEVLRKQFGGQLNIKAVLFDASVTENVKENKIPETSLATKINALTGISQISLWEQVSTHKQQLGNRLKKEGEEFEERWNELIYRLPSLENLADIESDVLQVHDAETPTDAERRVGIGAESPASSVCLIFSENDRAVLDSHEDYYEMAGRALYAQLKFSMVGRSVVNYKSFFNSIGGASIEVPSAKIQDYLEANSRVSFLESLSDIPDVVAPALEEAMNKIKPATGFGENDGYENCVPGPGTRDEELSLWQRCVKRLLDARSANWSQLEADLVKGKNLADLLNSLQNYAMVGDEEINIAVGDTLRSLLPETTLQTVNTDTGLEVLRPYLEKIYYRGASTKEERGNSRQRNLQGISKFCESLDAAIDSAIRSLPEKVRFGEDKPIETVFETAKKRPLVIAGRPFDEADIIALRQAADAQLLRNTYPQLKDAFSASLRAFFAPAKVVSGNAEAILDICREVQSDVGKELAEEWDVGDGSFAKCHQEVFSDPNEPDRGLDHEDAQRFYKRVLKPALSREAVHALCVDTKSLNLGDPEEMEKVDEQLLNNALSSSFGDGEGRDKIGFAKNLDARLKRAITIKSDLVKERFNLNETLDTLRKAWAARLPKVRHDNDDLEKALHTFQSLFGRRPQEKMGEFDVGSTEELLKDMTASLASTTTAYWKLKDSNSSQRSVFIFLPKQAGDFQKDEWDKYLAERMPPGVEPSVAQGEKGEANPFAIVAFAIESTNKGTPDNPHGSLDNIISLNYWRETSVVRHLQRAEEKSGANALFNPVLPGMNGSTFHDPIYVVNEVYARLRWRPWYERKASAAAADEAEDGAIKALIYMFMEPVGEIGNLAQASGWKFPLAKFDDNGTLALTRGGLKVLEGEKVVDDHGKFEAGAIVGAKKRGGLSGAKEWLSSEAGQDTLESILAEREAFWGLLEKKEGIDKKKKPFAEFCDELYKSYSVLRQGPGGQERADKDIWNEIVTALQNHDPNLV
jgi:hypothetical protein